MHRMPRRPRNGLEHARRVAVRVTLGEKERVRTHLSAIADPVSARVAKPARHLPGDERREPAEKRTDSGEHATPREATFTAAGAASPVAGEEKTDWDAEPAAERRTDRQRRDREHDPEQDRPPALRLRLSGQDDVDRILARLADKARIRVSDEIEIRAQVHAVADVRAEEAMEQARWPAHEQRREPVEDPDDQGEDRPEDEPDV